MSAMKAFAFVGPDAVEPVSTRVPIPTIDPGEILVRVRAIGVGIHDAYFLPEHKMFPYPIGIEAAGEIERVGAGVTGHTAGDRVAFVSMMQPKGGTWAEHAVVSANSLILPIPDTMGFERAAAVPVGGNTALRAFATLDAAGPDSDSTMFIAGASGAVGTFAVQIAKRAGWTVAASASAANHDHLEMLGADPAVDYRDPEWPARVRAAFPGGVDGAIAIQPDTSAPSAGVVRDGGTVVTVSADSAAPPRGVTVRQLDHALDVRTELGGLMEDIAAGRMHLEVERVHRFDEAADALAKVRSRHARGKVVIAVD